MLRIRCKGSHRSDYAFAAIKDDGSVVTWGDYSTGGDASNDTFGVKCSALATIGDTECLSKGVKKVFSNSNAFAALKENGSVVTWGYGFDGGIHLIKTLLM